MVVNCWMCEQEHGVPENTVGKCQNCGVEIDTTPNIPFEELQKEEDVGNLKDWAKQNAKFIKIKDGESYEGVYNGYKEGVNMNGEPAVIYKIDDKEFKSSSTKLAEIFADMENGTKVKISRTGEGLQTKWTVEKI